MQAVVAVVVLCDRTQIGAGEMIHVVFASSVVLEESTLLIVRVGQRARPLAWRRSWGVVVGRSSLALVGAVNEVRIGGCGVYQKRVTTSLGVGRKSGLSHSWQKE